MIAAFFAGQTVFGFYFAWRGFDFGDVCAWNYRGDYRRFYLKTNDSKISAAAVCDGIAAVSSAEFAKRSAKYVQ
ncbi:MAG: hypothetical protein WKF73_16475 [Nocardioidaceae bacterium]